MNSNRLQSTDPTGGNVPASASSNESLTGPGDGSEIAISVKGLTKRYGNFFALNRCDLTVKRGAIFGLLGPNGAGKTTLLRTLLGYIKPTSGSAKIHGFDCVTESVALRRECAYLPAEAKVFRSMRGKSALRFFGEMHPHGSYDRGLRLAERLELNLNRRVAFMSTGMRQKLAIASVLSCAAPLIILDEPTANLDPTVRSEVLKIVGECCEVGQTVVLSSHVLSEIEEVCHAAAIMRAGEMVHAVTLTDLRLMHRADGRASSGFVLSDIESNLPNGVRLVRFESGRVVIDLVGELERHLNWLQSIGLTDLSIQPIALRSVYDQYHCGSSK